MICSCPVCDKRFEVLWPHQWAYKIGAQPVCSWKCIRANEKQNEGVKEMDARQKVPDEAKKKAIQAAIDGKDPYEYLRPYTSNPKSMWTYIKSIVKKKDPELYAKLPDLRERKKEKPETLADAMEGMQDAAEEFFGMCEDMGLSIHSVETPEDPAPQYKAIVLKSDIQYKIRSIQTDLGTYSADDEYFEFKSAKNKSDAIEMTIEDMVALAKELPDAMRLLGVEL